MPKTKPLAAPHGNRLLARLPAEEYERLLPRLQVVPLELKQVLYQARSPIDHAYFPNRGVVSALTVMEGGRAIEVATIGDEGMVGLPLIVGAKTTANRMIVQVPGDALRMAEDVLREEVSRDSALRRLLTLYHTAFFAQVSQAVACNGLHSVYQRCCRWLLMTQDRAHSDVFPMTHEFLAEMLGVRRSTVSEVLEPFQEKGLIRYSRGKFTVLDRDGLTAGSCECYRSINEEFARLFG
ncbi:MAG TPA: Crp/Fnr family transcriptional regulator [Pirellulales bacterium]|nr:Crp/Fnr family transcriptional regulator [Pirellulales bacterium]